MYATATLNPNDAPTANSDQVVPKRPHGSSSVSEADSSLNARINRASNTKSTNSRNIVYVQKDTKAWGVQVWISFGIAVFLCGVGLAYLPGADLDRAFMVMGYFFCLSAAFVLSKFVRDNASTNQAAATKRDTPLYGAVVYVAFAAAIALTGWGLYRMGIADSYKAYLLVSWLYLITTTFTLAKTLRDRHEAALAEARLSSSAERPMTDL
jgi:hypothetical protein